MLNVKKMLEEYNLCKQNVPKIHKQLTELIESEKYGPILKAAVNSGMPHGSGISNPTLEVVEECVDHVEKIFKSMSRHLENIRHQYDNNINVIEVVERFIHGTDSPLTTDEKQVLIYRYIDRLNWEDVRKKMNYEQKQPFNIHNSAMAKMHNYIVKHK